MNKAHSPQDYIYGPLEIPAYCWPIIDTPEFQRLRYVKQLGCVDLVYPGTNHTRLEHSLGTAHLAVKFMEHFKIQQPELNIQEKHVQAIVIAGLCHDLGHGPFSHIFDQFAVEYSPDWTHEKMSVKILKYIYGKYKVPVEKDVIKAAGRFILGRECEGYPEWLSLIVANKETDIDIDKFDYLSRDMNRSLSATRFEFDRLIVNCKVIDNQLSWKLSEVQTIDRLFFSRNNMHERVYQHPICQSIGLMIKDMMEEAREYINFDIILSDPEEFCRMDDRILYLIEQGKYGPEAQKIAIDIRTRHLYKVVGEMRVKPNDGEGLSYSQKPIDDIVSDIASQVDGLPESVIRVQKMKFRYGLSPTQNPLQSIPFWQPGNNKIIKLSPSDISCIEPKHFSETAMRGFVTDPQYLEKATEAFDKWKQAFGV